ncbi:alpha/beta hydrolase [Pontixanthobacter sp. CEM42]|uniref:alpha/beta fold hydrolase n=1 Tax=Pontixanthobacter sp. CEM42 TaxID=2792077 RepID=UPI001ADFA4F9|nr:alpha/beta hydrolase [Pontixanthobacter sp. CEM42]
MTIRLIEWREQARHFEFEGQRIAYWTAGTGKPLLMVHGFPTASWDWVPIWDRMSAQHSLIACDMIGFGLSDKPHAGYSIHRQTDMQLALLDHLGITDFDALVHDYGVSVGQELLARQEEGSGAAGLGKMVFLNGGIFPDQHRARPIQKLGVSPLGFLVSRMLSRKGFGKSFSSVFGPDTQPTEQELDEFWSLIAEQDGNRIFHKLLHYIGDRRDNEARWVGALTYAADRIGLINGAKDPVSGEHAFHRWKGHVPVAKAHLLPNIGHYPQVEAPEEVASKALEWLA